MKYRQPFGVVDEDASYVNGNPAIGLKGSIIDGRAIEESQREIVKAIIDGGLADPSASDLAQLSKTIRFMRLQLAADTGAADAIRVTLSPAPVVWAVPLAFVAVVAHTNTIAGVTIEVTGIGTTKTVKRRDGAALSPGDLVAGTAYPLAYDGTHVRVLTPVASELASTTAGRRNLLDNGDLSINQRQFAGGALTSGVYGYDRWKAGASGTSVSVNASTGVVTLTGTIKQIIRAGSGSQWGVWNTLAGQAVAISVDDPSADLAVSIGDGGANTASGTITAGSGRRGTSLVIPAGATGNVHFAVTAATARTFRNVLVERGNAVQAFERPDPSLELLRCKRAYRKSFNYGTVPGSVHAGDSGWWNHTWFAQMFPVATSAWQEIGHQLSFDVEMWGLPTVKVWDANGVANKVSLYTGAGGAHRDNVGVAYQDHVGASWSGYEVSVLGTPQHIIAWHYSASAGTYGFFFGYECDADL